MQVDLRAQALEGALTMWKSRLDLDAPRGKDFDLRAVAKRHNTLKEYIAIGNHWGLMLLYVAPQPEHQVEYRRLKETVINFQLWAEMELQKIAAEDTGER